VHSFNSRGIRFSLGDTMCRPYVTCFLWAVRVPTTFVVGYGLSSLQDLN